MNEENNNKFNQIIVCTLGLVGLAFFAYLIMIESNKKYIYQQSANTTKNNDNMPYTDKIPDVPSIAPSQNQVCQPIYPQYPPIDYVQLQQIQHIQERINQIETRLIQIPIQVPNPVPTIAPPPSPTPTITPSETPTRRQVSMENDINNNILSDNNINDPNIMRANTVRTKNTYNITRADEDAHVARMFDML